MSSKQQPTIDDFRIKQESSIGPAKTDLAKRRNILILHKTNPKLTPRQLAGKVYSGTIPPENAPMFSPEGSTTCDHRLAARFDHFVDWVEQVIKEQGESVNV